MKYEKSTHICIIIKIPLKFKNNNNKAYELIFIRDIVLIHCKTSTSTHNYFYLLYIEKTNYHDL